MSVHNYIKQFLKHNSYAVLLYYKLCAFCSPVFGSCILTAYAPLRSKMQRERAQR